MNNQWANQTQKYKCNGFQISSVTCQTEKKKQTHNKGVKAKQTNQFEAKVIFILCMSAIETLAKA